MLGIHARAATMNDKRLVMFVSENYYDSPSPVLVVPEGMDLAAEKESYGVWLKEKIKPTPGRGYIGYLCFVDWLVTFRGAVDAKLETHYPYD